MNTQNIRTRRLVLIEILIAVAVACIGPALMVPAMRNWGFDITYPEVLICEIVIAALAILLIIIVKRMRENVLVDRLLSEFLATDAGNEMASMAPYLDRLPNERTKRLFWKAASMGQMFRRINS